jgi:DNA-binding CsgD family transcriptional regulator
VSTLELAELRAAMRPEDVERLRVDAELAFEWLAPGSYFRSAALHVLEVAHLLAGNEGSLDATAAQVKERTDGEDPEALRSPMRLAASLTPAELRLLPLLATHLSFREIGERLCISRNTVKTEAISAYRKLNASSRSEAVEHAAELGLIETTAATGACGLVRNPAVTREQLSQLALVVVALVDAASHAPARLPPKTTSLTTSLCSSEAAVLAGSTFFAREAARSPATNPPLGLMRSPSGSATIPTSMSAKDPL